MLFLKASNSIQFSFLPSRLLLAGAESFAVELNLFATSYWGRFGPGLHGGNQRSPDASIATATIGAAR